MKDPLQTKSKLNQLETSRSCPTGFHKNELKRINSLELFHLRATTYEYLKTKASKTRNKQFIFLIERINNELIRRNQYIPIEEDKPERPTKTVIKSGADSGEYFTFLKRKREGRVEYKRSYCSNGRTNTNHSMQTVYFTLSSQEEVLFPDFLQEKLEKDKLAKQESYSFLNYSTDNKSPSSESSSETNSNAFEPLEGWSLYQLT